MSRPAFASGFAAELDAYIDMKVACGVKPNIDFTG